jgi:ABC-type Fe3+ transport system permease subunit
MTAVIASFVLLVLAVSLFAIGRWGRRNAAGLVPSTLPPEVRQKRERSLLRGALTCQVLALFFVVLALGLLIDEAVASPWPGAALP